MAIQSSKYAAKEIMNRLAGKPSQGPFKYSDKGNMAIISRFRAVALIGKLRFTGFIAWLMWLGLHLIYLTGFKKGHRAAALDGQLCRPQPFPSHCDRTADLRPRRPQPSAKRRRRPGQPTEGARRRAQLMATNRRTELEAKAAEEARLTDMGERGTRKQRNTVA